MTPSHNIAAPGGPEQGITVSWDSLSEEDIAVSDDSDRMKSFEDEINLLKNENKSLRDDVTTLKKDVKTLLIGNDKEGPSAIIAISESDAESGNPSDEANAAVAAMEGSAANKNKPSEIIDEANTAAVTTNGTVAKKNKKKKTKSKKKKKKGNKIANYWDAGGSLKKIALGSISIALLVSMTLGQGIIGGGTSSLFRDQKGGQTIREKLMKIVESSKVHEEGGATSTKVLVSKDKKKILPRILQADTSSTPSVPPSTSAPPEAIINQPSIFAPETSNEASSEPTASVTATGTNTPPAFLCDADPETCGCPNLNQTDYRGSIDTTGVGPCLSWNDDDVAAYPDAGLEENYCRNPDNDSNGPWCMGEDTEFYYCDVPMCREAVPTATPTISAKPTVSTKPSVSLSPSANPTSSSSPTQTCQIANKNTCGCAVVSQSDYRGTISTTAEDIECHRWDSKWVLEDLYFGLVDFEQQFPDDGLEDNNFCRNPTDDTDGPWCVGTEPNSEGDYEGLCDIPFCNPCSCMPPCGEPNNEKCGCPSALQAEECCGEEDASCKCSYLKDACRKSLENNSTDFCDDAEAECCQGSGDPNCKCGMYEQMCTEFPDQFACDFAADSCCNIYVDEGAKITCLCDFYNYTSNALSYGSKYKSDACSGSLGYQFTSPTIQNAYLTLLFEETGGEYWFNNTGWLDEKIPQCQWFGLTCRDDGLLTEMNLRNNNLTGANSPLFFAFPELRTLDIAENNISGPVNMADYMHLRKLEHIDMSKNSLSGHANMLFTPVTSYVNFSYNNFTSASFRRFNAAYETLEVVDLSHNRIDQDASEIFFNIPPNLERFSLSYNAMRGALPDPISLARIGDFQIANNNINGPIPTFRTPRLRILDLSHQTSNRGLTGSIPRTFFVLPLLTHLNFAGNSLSQGIPSFIGNMGQLKVLNLSSNVFSQSIPTEFGRLRGIIEVLDLSKNQLSGLIPPQLSVLQDVLVRLEGNSNIANPAPLPLCFMPTFDVMNDSMLCPPERSALQEFYDSAKGGEWTVSDMWVHPYESVCNWHGITCDDSNNTVKLNLINNGLSGTLTKKIADLSMLEVLDLSDNDIKGSIPTEIGLLSNLNYLRLSYNGFQGNEINFGNLQHLKLIQLHGNRLSGSIPSLNLEFNDPSSFVADCGNPSDFEDSLNCEDCTMCCNVQGDCYPKEESDIQKLGFKNYMYFTGVFFACVFGACCVLAFVSLTYDKFRNSSSSHQPPRKDIDRKYALETVGDDSVYQFLIGTSWIGWSIVLVTMASQIWILFVFVQGAEVNLSDDKSDLAYTYKCPRDQDECRDTSDLTWQGWTVYAILMAAYLMKDAINGAKLIVLSAKKRHSSNTKTRLFFGGTLLASVTSFTFYVSTIYNAAIATSNTDIIVNSVVILFITDVDELFYDILMVINPHWVETMSPEEEEESDAEPGRGEKDEEDSQQQQTKRNLDYQNLEGDVQKLKKDVQVLHKTMDLLQEQNAELKRRLTMPQDLC